MTKAAQTEGKSLATRLFAILFALIFLSFVVATAITAYMSWTVYEGDAEERLITQLNLCVEQIEGKSNEDMTDLLSRMSLADTRITLVAGDGTVVYDSSVDANIMENHASRAEIQAAREQGKSIVQRRSETTGTDSLYAAARVSNDGTVLRLAESRTSLAFYLGSLLLPLVIAVFLAAMISALIARVVTRRVTTPLLDIDLSNPLESETYREIRPLLNRIDAQRIELKGQNMQLERTVELRREFTGNVSHEMKSPLQVIGGYAELIEGGIASPEDTRKFAGIIRSESQVMRELVDDVLMLSRLDEDISEEPQQFNLSNVISRAVDRLSSKAESENVALELSTQDDIEVVGFETHAEQAVYNLIDNAIRYGGSRVEIVASADGEKAQVVVSDDGPGVPQEQRDRVFERFYRVDPSRSRETGGTGLGLAIVKHAAEDMGGTVYVRDAAIGGAEFVLELPTS